MTRPTYVQATDAGGAWTLPPNALWNVPAGDDKRGDMETRPPWGVIVRYRALAVDLSGRVYGWRSLESPHESGYQLEGRVKVGGKRYRAFTSSQLFQRADGTLCDVATLIVCNGAKSSGEIEREAQIARIAAAIDAAREAMRAACPATPTPTPADSHD